jgi:hypothetical protein
MTGRITGLIYDPPFGAIAGEDGVGYAFDSRSLVDVTFEVLHVGALVTFVADPEGRRATAVRIDVPDIEHLR